ncbi:MAG TPA: hypothetical protein VL098_08805 [Flavipsychrobacter sp.]|nr:hypothetical protein [Flavipsychrobacter sp.]
MKKIIILIAFVLSFQTLPAQTFSGGLRTGTSLWFTKDYTNEKPHFTEGQNMTWDKGLFLRYKVKNRFSMEVSVNHYHYFEDRKADYNSMYDAPWFYKADYNIHNYEMDVNFQYDVTCKKFKSCGLLKNVESYIGISLTPTWVKTYYDDVFEGGGWYYHPLTARKGSNNQFIMTAGVNHILNYNIADHIYLTSKAAVAADPFNVFSGYYGDRFGRMARLSWQIGAGYRF